MGLSSFRRLQMLYPSDSDEDLLMILTTLAMQKRSKRQRESTSRRRRSIQRRFEFNSSNKFNIDQIKCCNQDSQIKDDLEESGCSACDDTDGESGPRRKLPRGQRKKLRKKKLKEDASRRGNTTGPLLPLTSESEAGNCGGGGGDVETELPDTRRNAAETKVDATADNSGEGKKKLKEDASRRGNIIGPLLHSTGESEAGDCGGGGGGGGGDVETEPPGVRLNDAEKKVDATADNSGEEAASANKKKLKHRRMAKRLANGRLKSSNMENCNQNDQPCAEDVGSTST